MNYIIDWISFDLSSPTSKTCRTSIQRSINFLATVSPKSIDNLSYQKRFLGEQSDDCPVFDGLFDFCRASAGGSIGAAVRLNRRESDIAINWAGGLHHAKKSEASGFCYVNDIVLGILELLKTFKRVLYIDIDVHHGDGVEEAFFATDRVMTVSFHKYDGEYFPGTGHISDIGINKGKYYSVNFPLKDGVDDACFHNIFTTLIEKVIEVYQPEAIVLQSGADSLSGDPLGTFNLSLKAHAYCLKFLRAFDIPLMLLGGGGYTVRNVARCWIYEEILGSFGAVIGVWSIWNLWKRKEQELKKRRKILQSFTNSNRRAHARKFRPSNEHMLAAEK